MYNLSKYISKARCYAGFCCFIHSCLSAYDHLRIMTSTQLLTCSPTGLLINSSDTYLSLLYERMLCAYDVSLQQIEAFCISALVRRPINRYYYLFKYNNYIQFPSSICGMFLQGYNITRTPRKFGFLHPFEILPLTAVNQLLLGVQTA